MVQDDRKQSHNTMTYSYLDTHRMLHDAMTAQRGSTHMRKRAEKCFKFATLIFKQRANSWVGPIKKSEEKYSALSE